MKKKILLRWLLLLIVILSALTETRAIGQFTFITHDGSITITGYTGTGGNVIIPDNINGCPVTSITYNSFMNCTGLTSVIIPNGITNIGSYAFYDCSSLTNVTLGAGVSDIGEFVFGYCLKLKTITVDQNNPFFSSVAGILFNKNQTVFVQYPAGITGNFIIPDSVTNIKSEAFWNCSGLTNITIGNNVINIGMSAFNNCYNLASITIPNSVVSIGDDSFSGCESLTNIIIGNSVTNIGDYAFAWCIGISTFTIPNSVTHIGEGAFTSCDGATSITIGSNVNSIGAYAFGSSINLTTLYFQGNAPTAVEKAVNGGTVYYLAGTTGWDLFFPNLPSAQCTTNDSTLSIAKYHSTNSSVIIPSAINNLPVTAIGPGAFSNYTNLVSITIGNKLTNVGDNAFSNCCNLVNVFFEGNAPTYLGSNAFYGDSGITIYYLAETTGWSATFDIWPTIPSDLSYMSDKGVTTITKYTGSGGAISIPKNINRQTVIGIGRNAFYNCPGLTSVTIPDSVTNIVGAAFQYCSSLITITVDPKNPAYSSMAGVLYNKNQTMLIQYPGGKVGSYTTPDSLTSIGDDSFADCYNLNGVTIGNTVTNIGTNAFFGCVGLISATLPANVTSISDGTFLGCISLTNLTVGNAITSIGNYAFFNCGSLSSFTMGNSVTNIGSLAFYNCSSLTVVYFRGDAPASVGSDVFGGIDGIDPLTIYYLPRTTNWSAMFNGLPTSLWLPQVEYNGSKLRVQTNLFGFNVNWASGQTVVIEASTDLLNWQPVQTNTLATGTCSFSDPQWTNYPNRYYRIRSQ